MPPDDEDLARADAFGSVVDWAALPLSGVALDAPTPPVAGAAAEGHPFATGEAARYADPQILARGGMGRVSAVTDARLRRQVALKQAAVDDPGAAALERRLAQEAWITAQLEHPGIVPVYDAGHAPDGAPFFTMRLIRGRSLATALEDGDLDQGALLRHFLAVCQAMGYAHAMGVVHRDLKPANIMLGEHGETQIVDWGLARSLAAPPDDGTDDGAARPPALVPDALAARTMVGARVGTPAYMSPEQAHAAPLGRASDVWSLGAILFELVTGRGLYEGLATAEIFVRLDRGPIPRADAVAPDAPPELAAVIARALALTPEDRYPDAKALAADVAAFLDGRRVDAHAYSAWDLVRRFARAFRVPLLVGGAGLVAIAVVFALSYSRTREERDRAQAAEAAATAARDRAVAAERRTATALAEVDRSVAALLVRSAEEAASHGARAEAELLAAHALRRGPSPEARGVLARWSGADRPRLVAVEPAPDCVSARWLPSGRALLCLEEDATSLWDGPPLALRWRIPVRLDAAAPTSDARALVSGPTRGAVAVLDLEEGVLFDEQSTLVVVSRAVGAAGAAFVDNGATPAIWRDDLAASWPIAGTARSPRAVSRDGRVGFAWDDSLGLGFRVDLATGDVVTLRQLVGPERGPISAALSPDGDRLALGSVRGDLLVVSLPETQRLLLSRPWTRSILQIAWSPDGRALATRDERGWVAVVAADGGARLALPRVRAAEVAWREADDGALELALVGEEVRVYRVPRAIVASRVDGDAGLSSIAVSADGARLALPDGSGSVRVLASDTGTVLDEVLGDGVTVAKHAAFRADGALAVLWPARLEVALLGPEPGRGPQRVSSDLNYRRVATLPGGDLLVAGYGSGLFRLAGREHAQVIRAADGGEMLDVTVAPGGGAVAWLSSRGTVEVAAVGADDVVGPGRVVFEDPAATRVALDAAGARLAIARGGEVALVDVARGELIGGYRGDGARFTEVAVTADGAQVAAGTVDGAVWLWRDDGALRFVGRGHGERVSGVAFGPRGDWLVSGAWDGVALRWDLRGLDAPAEALVAELEGTWGIDLEGATAADLR